MNVHFIAIGGSAMHNLAIALHQKGYIVTGSDDEIFEPSKSRLANLRIVACHGGMGPCPDPFRTGCGDPGNARKERQS